jgi:thiol-disulfide isomerase/thioredoxin
MVRWVLVALIGLTVAGFGGPFSVAPSPTLEKGQDEQFLHFQYDMPLRPITARNNTLEGLKDQNALVFFFSATCGHCKQSVPHLLKIAEEYKEKGLKMVAISVKANRDQQLADFIDAHKVTVPVYQDSKRSFSRTYGTGSVPVILLLNKKGNIVKFSGYNVGHTGNTIRETLDNKYVFSW